jgi:hypothetical protein
MGLFFSQEHLNLVKNSPFFTGNKRLNSNRLEEIFNIPLNRIKWPVRFKKVICTQFEISTLGQLLNMDSVLFLIHPNIGKKTILDTRQGILYFLTNPHTFSRISTPDIYEGNYTSSNSLLQYPMLRWYQKELSPEIISMDIDKICLSRKVKEFIKTKGIKTIKDFLIIDPMSLFKENPDYRKISKDIIKTIEDNASFVNKIEKENEKWQIIHAIEYVLSNISIKELDICNKRWVEGNTLDEIGHIYNLTRERIRQILEKVTNKVSSNFDFLFINWRYFFLQMLIHRPFPIDEEFLKDYPHKLKERLYLGILSEIFEEIPFHNFLTKNLNIKRAKVATRNKASIILQMIENIQIVIGENTPGRIIAELKNQQLDIIDQLFFFKFVFMQRKYFFFYDNSKYYLLKRGNSMVLNK